MDNLTYIYSLEIFNSEKLDRLNGKWTIERISKFLRSLELYNFEIGARKDINDTIFVKTPLNDSINENAMRLGGVKLKLVEIKDETTKEIIEKLEDLLDYCVYNRRFEMAHNILDCLTYISECDKSKKYE